MGALFVFENVRLALEGESKGLNTSGEQANKNSKLKGEMTGARQQLCPEPRLRRILMLGAAA